MKHRNIDKLVDLICSGNGILIHGHTRSFTQHHKSIHSKEWTSKRTQHVESTSTQFRYYVDTTKTKYWWISESFQRIFFDVISMSKRSTSFWRIFFNIVLMDKKTVSFQRTFFVIILMGLKSKPLRSTIFDVILMEEKLTLFWCTL